MNSYPQISEALPTEFPTEKQPLSTGCPHEKSTQA